MVYTVYYMQTLAKEITADSEAEAKEIFDNSNIDGELIEIVDEDGIENYYYSRLS